MTADARHLPQAGRSPGFPVRSIAAASAASPLDEASNSARVDTRPAEFRTRFEVEHIRIVSRRSFADVRAAMDHLPRFDERLRSLLDRGNAAAVKAELEKIQGDVGLMVFSVATHGDWLAILSGRRNALQYVIGNILVSTQMTQHGLMAGLYAPLRVILYENDAGTATIEYDRPSDLFGQFGVPEITAVARELDETIHRVVVGAAA
jgi:hypothetical protein